jgi:multidrug efflux pump subunit AcrB
VLALALSPVDAQGAGEENAVYAHVEFEPGASVQSVDQRLADYTRILSELPGIEGVQSTARRGSGSVLVRFSPAATRADAVAEACRRTGVPGGFAWVPEPSNGERSWTLTVSGDDDAECRRLAALAAEAVSSLPFVLDTVLDFKPGPEDVVLRPDRVKASVLGTGFAQAAEALRRGVHGPVAYKRIDDNGETDVRVTTRRAAGGMLPGIADAESLLVPTQAGTVRVDSFMRLTRERDVSRIYRSDRRRVASITMRSLAMDPRKARDMVMKAIAGIDRPAAYSLEFDRGAIEAAEKLGGVGFSFLVAALLSYMASAMVTESFGAPLVVLSSLPPALAVPALLMAATGKPMNAAIACAFVAVSGMAVNASVLTVEERRSDERRRSSRSMSVPAGAMDLYRITRARLGSLAATSGTSIAGALPLLVLSGSGDAMARALAFVTATGTAASFFVALTVVPAMARAWPRLFRNFALSRTGPSDGPETG